jgi:hypothetical protein
MTSGATFEDHAVAALRAHPGAWHCMPCWARAADLSAPEDVTRPRALARRLRRFSREHEIINAGACDRCGGVMKDDLPVREWAGGRRSRPCWSEAVTPTPGTARCAQRSTVRSAASR